VSRNQSIFAFAIKSKAEAAQQLATFSGIRDSCLLIDGTSLQICIENYKEMFITLACRAPCVVCCRCSPTQKVGILHVEFN
jgi:phospholipid-translocating ATPase